MLFLTQVLTDPLQPRPPRPCPCGQTVTFNRRTVSTHVSQLNLTTAGAGILNLLSIVYALRPRLRSRLTLGGRTFPRNPWDLGEPEFNWLYRYLCLHSHSQALHGRLPLPLRCTWNAFLPLHLAMKSIASVYGLSPDHFRRNFARWVSCYALFK